MTHSSLRKILPALGLAACLVAGASAAAESERPRTVTVSGQGEVQAEPDQAIVMLGVESRKPRLEDARAEVAKTVEAVLKLTRDLKIDQKYVKATRINVQPEYNWDNSSRERNLIGYFVSRQVEVDLRDLEKLGTLLEKATDLGVNQLGDPRLDSSKRRDLERSALAKAVEDARLNAEAIAKAAGARLGAARTIAANSGFSPPVPMMARAKSFGLAADSAEAAQTYQSGEMSFNGHVQIEYDLIVAP